MLKVTELSKDFAYNVSDGNYRIAFKVKENLWDLTYFPINTNPLEEWDWMTAADWEDLADCAGWNLEEIPEIPFIVVAFAMYNWFGPTDTFGQSYTFTNKADALKILQNEQSPLDCIKAKWRPSPQRVCEDLSPLRAGRR